VLSGTRTKCECRNRNKASKITDTLDFTNHLGIRTTLSCAANKIPDIHNFDTDIYHISIYLHFLAIFWSFYFGILLVSVAANRSVVIELPRSRNRIFKRGAVF
jgi:hypothetical protein